MYFAEHTCISKELNQRAYDRAELMCARSTISGSFAENHLQLKTCIKYNQRAYDRAELMCAISSLVELFTTTPCHPHVFDRATSSELMCARSNTCGWPGVLLSGGPFVKETTPFVFFVRLVCRSLLLGSFEIHVCSTKYMWVARIVVFRGFLHKREHTNLIFAGLLCRAV